MTEKIKFCYILCGYYYFVLRLPSFGGVVKIQEFLIGCPKNINLKKSCDQYFLKVILSPTKALAVIAVEILFAAEKSLSHGEGFRVRKQAPKKNPAEKICGNIIYCKYFED